MTVASQELSFRTHHEGDILDVTREDPENRRILKDEEWSCNDLRGRINRSPNNNRVWTRTFGPTCP